MAYPIDLCGRVALVTGPCSGLGRQFAKVLARAGTEGRAFGRLRNHAGWSPPQRRSEVTPRGHGCVTNTSARGAFFVAQAVARRKIARSQGKGPGTHAGGRSVDVASPPGRRLLSQVGTQRIIKAAVVHRSKALALAGGRHGMHAPALRLGCTSTQINHHPGQAEAGQKQVQGLPRRRVGPPADLHAVRTVRCGRESHFVNGAIWAADDGLGV